MGELVIKGLYDDILDKAEDPANPYTEVTLPIKLLAIELNIHWQDKMINFISYRPNITKLTLTFPNNSPDMWRPETNHTLLRQLLSNQRITSFVFSGDFVRDGMMIRAILSKRTNLTSLDFNTTSVTDEALQEYLRLLKTNKNLTSFKVAGFRFENGRISIDRGSTLSSKQVGMIFEALIERKDNIAATNAHDELTTLNIENINFDDNLTQLFANLIGRNKKLQRLSLRNCKINDAKLEVIASALQENNELCAISLDENQIELKNENVAKAFQSLKLSGVYLSRNSIEDNGLINLARWLRDRELTELNLSFNQITAESQEIKDLFKSRALTQLILDHNKIRDKGLEYIADALEGNIVLEFLSLENNLIQGKGKIHGAFRSPKLKHIVLGNNKISDEAFLQILPDIYSCNELLTLVLFNNRIGNNGVKAIAEAIYDEKFPNLNTLNLATNKIEDSGASELLAEVSSSTTTKLRVLVLKDNCLTDEIVPNLRKLLTNKPEFYIRIGCNALTKKGYDQIIAFTPRNNPSYAAFTDDLAKLPSSPQESIRDFLKKIGQLTETVSSAAEVLDRLSKQDQILNPATSLAPLSLNITNMLTMLNQMQTAAQASSHTR